jgi:hypothetical protein
MRSTFRLVKQTLEPMRVSALHGNLGDADDYKIELE